MADARDLLIEAGYTQEEVSEVYGTNSFDISEQSVSDYVNYKDAGVSSFLLGVADSLSFGTSNYMLTRSGLVDKSTIEAISRYNPKSHLLGEIGTDIATVLLSGGTSLLGKGIAKGARRGLGKSLRYAPTKLIDNLGDDAYKWASKRIDNQLGKKVSGFGTKVALESGAFSVRQDLSDVAIEDRETTIGEFSERLFTNAANNSVAGLIFGGSLGAAGHLVGPVLKRGGKWIKGQLPETNLRKLINEDIKGWDKAKSESAETLPPGPKSRAYAAEPETLSSVVKQAYDDKTLKGGLDINGDDILKAIDNGITQRVDDITEVVRKAGSSGIISKGGSNEAVVVNVIDDMLSNPSFDVDELGFLRRQAIELSKDSGNDTLLNLTDLKRIRTRIGKNIFGKPKYDVKSAQHEYYTRLFDEYSEQMKATFDQTGFEGLGSQFELVDDQVRALRNIKEAAQVQSKGSAFTLEKLFNKFIGRGLGTLATDLVLPGGVIVGGVAQESLRKVGKFGKEQAFKKIVLQDIDSALVNFDKVLPEAVEGFFKKNKFGTSKVISNLVANYGKGEERIENYNKIKDDLGEFLDNPDKLIQNVENGLKPVSGVFPEVANTMAAQAGIVANYLRDNLISEPLSGNMYGRNQHIPSDLELDKFFEKYEIATNPMSAFDAIKNGQMSHNMMDALRKNWPYIHNTLLEHVTDYVVANQPKLTYNTKVGLGIITGLPFEPSMQPQNVAFFQRAIIEAGQKGQQPRSTRNASSIADNELTTTQRLQK